MKRTRIAAVVALVVALVAFPSAAVAAETPDFTPSPNKWRSFMINMMSSVLGAAIPADVGNIWKAEQIANAHKYDFSWEQMQAQNGIAGIRYDANGNMVGVKGSPQSMFNTGTYDDVVIAGLEDQYEARARANSAGNKPPEQRFKPAPSSKVKPWMKAVGGAGALAGGYLAYDLGVSLVGSWGADLLGNVFGYDANGLVCSFDGYTDTHTAIFRNMMGQDCSALDLALDYAANMDMPAEWSLASGPVGAYPYTSGGYGYVIVCAAGASLYGTNNHVGVNYTIHNQSGSDTVVQNSTQRRFAHAHCATLTGTSRATEVSNCYTVHPTSATCTGITITRVYAYSGSTSNVIEEGVQANPDPERQLQCDVTYTDGSTLTQLSDPYTESGGEVANLYCPPTPPGKTPESIQVQDTATGETVYEEEVTEEFQDWQTNHKECEYGNCKLDLRKKAGGVIGASCFDLEDGCAGWFEDPAKTDNYQCTYGVKTVSLAECNVYSGLFEPGRIETGAPYSDPRTGEWSGGQNSPKAGQKAMNTWTVQNPANVRNCDMSGIGFDPISWVLRPMQCWAESVAIPRPAVVQLHQTRMDLSWKGSTPGLYATSLAGVGDAFANLGAGHCGGFSFDLPVPGPDGLPVGRPSTLLDACPGSMLEPVATGVKWLLGGMALITGFIACRRLLFKFVGM
jgi:hypothetical protein